MKKKNKNKIWILLVVLLIILFCIGGYFLLDKRNRDTRREVNINEKIIINDIDISLYKYFYIKNKDNSLIVYDFLGNIIYKYDGEVTGYNVLMDKYIMINSLDKVVLIDKDGNLVQEGKKSMPIYTIEGKVNYIIIDNKIYDEEIKEIYEFSNDIYREIFENDNLYSLDIYNNMLTIMFVNKDYNILVNLNDEKVMYSKYDRLIHFDNGKKYIALGYDDKYMLIDTDMKKTIFENVTIDDNLNIINDDEVIYIHNDRLYRDGTKISDKYYMSHDNCQVGNKLVDNNKKVIIDKCMLYYEEYFDNVIMGYSDKESILYIDGNINVANVFYKVGDYIKGYSYQEGKNNEYKIYDKDGKVLEENKELYYINNDIYQEYDFQNDVSYFLDKDLNTITDEFMFANCNDNGYCVVTDDNSNKFLYKDGKKVTKNIYDEIEVNDDYITARMLFNSFIYILGEDKNIDIDYQEEVTVDIDDMISKYELDDMKEDIENNKELFIKYAYIVDNNDKLLEYKKQVMNMFKVVVDNKKYLNELTLLKKLGELSIEYADDLGSGIAATYTSVEVKIRLGEREENSLYHELMHFLDYSFNGKNSSYINNCNGKYVIKRGYSNGCEMVNFDTNFIVEAGAEVYSAKYFTKEMLAYRPAPTVLEALEYIYGLDEIGKWYFEDETYFKKIWLDIGYSYDETKEIIQALSNETNVNYYGNNNKMKIIDGLIDLYKYNNGMDFMNDNKFKYILRSLIDYRTDYKDSKYKNELEKIVNDEDKIIDIFKNTFKDYGYYDGLGFGDVLIIDDKMYISISSYKDNRLGTIFVDYDFDNNVILNYEYIYRT